MSRRSRRRDDALEKAVTAIILLPVLAWMFVPQARPLIVAVGVVLLIGVAGWLIYRFQQRQAQADADFLAKLTGTTQPLPSSPSAPKSANHQSRPRYATRKSVLSKAEIAFHQVLLNAVPEAPVFPKMRVADVMDAAERWSGDFLRISQKHFDWVLCHPVTFEPLIAIELDDSSHQWSDKQRKNDQVKDDAAREAGIALLRFPWQREYDAEKIRERLSDVLDQIADAKEAQT